jgi:alkylated DNA nucleotide flippase Atl1
MSSEEAVAAFCDAVGRELIVLASNLRAATEVPVLTTEPAPLDEVVLGVRQRQIVEVLAGAGDTGLKTSGIAREVRYDQANTHMTLKALEARSVVEQVPGSQPARWRLAPRYRATADPYLRFAALVRPGEWTTYGDISIAVRGDTNGARAVGRAAATLEHFPNPHRVIWNGGRIPPNWKTHDSVVPNPKVCREWLEDEGVRFDGEDKASRDSYVAWDVLVERVNQAA